MVYAFVRPREVKRVFATKGVAGQGRPMLSRSERQKGINKRKVRLFTIGVDEAKRLLFKRLAYSDPGPGYCHFPMSYNEEYFAQLTGEKLVKKYKKGFQYEEWQKTRPRNEALDIRILNQTALNILAPNWQQVIEMKNENLKVRDDEKKAVEKGQPIKTRAVRRRVRSRGVN
jgi:phage terminase large subunit GpA-like protein